MVAATAHASVRYYSHVERPNRMNADNTMKTTAKPSKHDWSRFDAMSQAQRHAAATRDSNGKPKPASDLYRLLGLIASTAPGPAVPRRAGGPTHASVTVFLLA